MTLNLEILGELLKEELKERGTTQKVFAEAIGISPSHLSEIIKGKRSIPIALLPQIVSFVGLSTDNLLECQANMNVQKKKEKVLSPEESAAEKLLQQYDSIICVKSLIKVLNASSLSSKERLCVLKNSYNLPAPEILNERFGQLSNRCFRRSLKNGCDPRMISTWVIKAEHAASSIHITAKYDSQKNEELAGKLSAVFHKNVNTISSVTKLLNTYGIGFAIVEKEEHASIDGYSFFSNGHPFIVITNRYKRIDNLAFTVMHEQGHIALCHTNKDEQMISVDERVIDDDDIQKTEKEISADIYATNWLIPEKVWCLSPKVSINPFAIQKVFTKWAKEKNLNEWIVLGRISHEIGMYRFKSDENRNIN